MIFLLENIMYLTEVNSIIYSYNFRTKSSMIKEHMKKEKKRLKGMMKMANTHTFTKRRRNRKLHHARNWNFNKYRISRIINCVFIYIWERLAYCKFHTIRLYNGLFIYILYLSTRTSKRKSKECV